MAQTIQLERRLTHDAALRLWDEISDARGALVELDCSEVAHISGTALQVLLVARRMRDENDAPLVRLVAPGDAFCEGVRLLGGDQLFPEAVA